MYTSVHVRRDKVGRSNPAPPQKTLERKNKFPLEKYPQVLSSINPSHRWGFSRILVASRIQEAVLVDDLVDGGLLVAGAGHDVLVVRRDVTAQDGRWLLGLQEEKKKE